MTGAKYTRFAYSCPFHWHPCHKVCQSWRKIESLCGIRRLPWKPGITTTGLSKLQLLFFTRTGHLLNSHGVNRVTPAGELFEQVLNV